MRFTESEIDWAIRLRGAGLAWDPQPGHYAFDINGVMKAGSPFQAGVYLIDSPNVMETAAGGDDELRSGFVWLPTWEHARDWLVGHDVPLERFPELLRQGLVDELSDRESLYREMLRVLEARGEG